MGGKFGNLGQVIRHAQETSRINSGMKIAITEEGGVGRWDYSIATPIAVCDARSFRMPMPCDRWRHA